MSRKKALIAALALHILLLVFPSVNEVREKTIEVFNRNDLDTSKSVVVSSQAKQQSESSKPADFFGEFHQRVEKQSQSPLKGKFQQGTGPVEDLSLGREGAPKNFQGGALSMGRNPYVLPEDIPYGNETVLNTDKVKYASFLNRIADEIYHPWVELAEEAIQRFRKSDRKVEPNLYVTRLKITMDDQGEIKAIQLVQSSGIKELDEAPKKALWEVEPFPHPPDQLIEEDGFVRLSYEFQFELKNSFFNIIPSRI